MSSARNRKGGDELKAGQTVLGRYFVERLLDEGGMASIYLARDIQTHHHVAIKCLYRMYTKSEVVRARFIDEGRIQMMLQHPNIVRVHQFMEQPTLAFIMEFIQGKSLEDLLLDRGVMDMGEILEVIIPVLSALGLAHSRHIVHRDLKPSNILLHQSRGAWHPKVMDFGVAKLKRAKSLTATGTTVGTLHYMSPEQIVGSKKIDGRADIYSIGITLYKLCTGDVPFNASTEFALMMAQVEAKPRPPREINPCVSEEFEAVVLKALAKKPEDRYQNIKAFTSALLDLHDAQGQRTRDTIDVPAALLEYAMMADEVAVDRTDEFSKMHSASTLEQRAYEEETRDTTERARPATTQHARPTRRVHPLIEEEGDEATLKIKQSHVEGLDSIHTLLDEDDEDGASTIELESLKLESLADLDSADTINISVDSIARKDLSTNALAQLVLESEQRRRRQTASLPSANRYDPSGPTIPARAIKRAPSLPDPLRTELAGDDPTTRIRVDRTSPSALNQPPPAPAKNLQRASSRHLPPPTMGSGRHGPHKESSSHPAKPPSQAFAPRPKVSILGGSGQTPSAESSDRTSPFERSSPHEAASHHAPLPDHPSAPSHAPAPPSSVGDMHVDTRDRTTPFRVPAESEPHVPTITADRYSPDAEVIAKVHPHTSLFEKRGSVILIALLVFFLIVCVTLGVLLFG